MRRRFGVTARAEPVFRAGAAPSRGRRQRQGPRAVLSLLLLTSLLPACADDGHRSSLSFLPITPGPANCSQPSCPRPRSRCKRRFAAIWTARARDRPQHAVLPSSGLNGYRCTQHSELRCTRAYAYAACGFALHVCIRVCRLWFCMDPNEPAPQATYRAHIIRARVRREMGEALQIVIRRRRRPRTLAEGLERVLRLASETPHKTSLALALSLSMMPAVSGSSLS